MGVPIVKHAVKYLDARIAPDLLRVAEHVRATSERLVLTRDNEPIAAVVPVKPRRRAAAPTAADIAASKAAAGGWRGLVDARRLKREIYASRGTDRPAVKL